MATKTTLRNGKVVTTTLPPTFDALEKEIRENARRQSEQPTKAPIVCYTPAERAQRRQSILELAKKAGISVKTEFYNDSEYEALAVKAKAIIEVQTATVETIATAPTWYLPTRGYFICRTATEKYGYSSAGVFIKSDRPSENTIHRLIYKGSKKEGSLKLTGNTTGTVSVWVVGNLTNEDLNQLIKGQPSWEVLRRVYEWDLNFWGTPKFNFNSPTIVY